MRLVWLSFSLLCTACGSTGNDVVIDGGAADDATSTSDAPPPPARLMYVSTGQGQRLGVIRLESDGTMTAQSALDVAVEDNTGALAFARMKRRLYLGVGGGLVTLELDGDGAPSRFSATPNTTTAAYIDLARAESVVVTAHFGANTVASYDSSVDIELDGGMLERDVLVTAEEPHATTVAPNGLIYVPHRGGNVTRWFSLLTNDLVNDKLVLEGELPSAPGVGPRHIAFTPDGAFAYLANEVADSVTAHSVAADGSLTAMGTTTTIPNDVDGGTNTCADVHVTPDGKFVYVSNRGHDSLAMFSIEQDGNLSPLGNVATETTPREFDIDPDGNYVVVAGQGSGALQSYAIESDGTLSAIGGAGRLEIGNDPRWVIID